jgi:hypothetical protein
MIKCPNCNSAQFKLITVNFEIDSNYDSIVYVQRVYQCDCKKIFATESVHISEDGEKIDHNAVFTKNQFKNMGV